MEAGMYPWSTGIPKISDRSFVFPPLHSATQVICSSLILLRLLFSFVLIHHFRHRVVFLRPTLIRKILSVSIVPTWLRVNVWAVCFTPQIAHWNKWVLYVHRSYKISKIIDNRIIFCIIFYYQWQYYYWRQRL